MEPLTLFASVVGLISALHILFSAEKFLTEGMYAKGRTDGKRTEWYCFFQPSDLLGTNDIGSQIPERSDHNLEQRRGQQANRPRLQA